jgi:hypothetical protein
MEFKEMIPAEEQKEGVFVQRAYFPDGEVDGPPVMFGNVEVILGNKVECGDETTVRVYRVVGAGKRLVVNHFHFGSWSDEEPPQIQDEESGAD